MKTQHAKNDSLFQHKHSIDINLKNIIPLKCPPLANFKQYDTLCNGNALATGG